jgi:hypothetical protein
MVDRFQSKELLSTKDTKGHEEDKEDSNELSFFFVFIRVLRG